MAATRDMKDIFLVDLDETLLDFPRAERENFHAVFARFAALPAGAYERFHVINDGLWKLLERGEIAREVLKVIVAPEELAVLEKHIDLNGYGEELLENEMRRGQSAMTDYGHIQRADGEMMFDCPEQPEPEMQL